MLPLDFIDRMKTTLDDEFNDFIESYDKPRYHALRINPLKTTVNEFLNNFKYNFEKVAWCESGFYYNDDIQPGKHPYHEAGVYYIQEPSAMSPASYLSIEPDSMVLDLCAAPGGKSTQIAGKMNGSGLLISNEIHPARAKILSENIERMGITNCIVTNETPEKLSRHFPEFFDRIMVDAPCSGEGMFRKNTDACDEWSLDNVKLCASRQAEILNFADIMLKPGGQLVYSTCTFAPLENEGTINSFIATHTNYEIEPALKYNGMSDGDIPGTVRLWPHKLKGEGHFLAVLRKKSEASGSSDYKEIKGLPEKDYKEYIDFCEASLIKIPDGKIIKFGDQLYALPCNAPDLKGLKVLRPGLHLGTILKNRFEPSHSLALSLTTNDVKYFQNLELSDKRVYQYINGETFESDGEKGWYLITVDNYSLGWGKLVNGTMKNHYPKGLRKKLSALADN